MTAWHARGRWAGEGRGRSSRYELKVIHNKYPARPGVVQRRPAPTGDAKLAPLKKIGLQRLTLGGRQHLDNADQVIPNPPIVQHLQRRRYRLSTWHRWPTR